MQTRDQQRAQQAFQRIGRICNEWERTKKEEYGRLCLQFPAYIFNCGLCQAVSFYEAKGADENKKPQYKEYLRDIFISATGDSDWSKIRTVDVQEYQQITRDVLVVANWFKRYAEALLKVKTGNENESIGSEAL